MIKTVLLILFALLFCLSLAALLLYRRQVRGLSQQLKNLEPESNQRLTCSVKKKTFSGKSVTKSQDFRLMCKEGRE